MTDDRTILTGTGHAAGTPTPGVGTSSRGALLHRASVVVAAPAAALLTWALLVPVLGVELATRQGEAVMTVGAGAVAVAGVLAAAAAWALLAVLERWTRRPALWTPIAWTVLVLSFLGPLSGVTGGAVLGLMLLHVAVGAAVLAVLRPRGARA